MTDPLFQMIYGPSEPSLVPPTPGYRKCFACRETTKSIDLIRLASGTETEDVEVCVDCCKPYWDPGRTLVQMAELAAWDALLTDFNGPIRYAFHSARRSAA